MKPLGLLHMQPVFVKIESMAKPFRLEAFLPYRLNLLAQGVSQQLSAIYAQRFDLDIPQWRILANLASRGELTARAITKITMSHKSTISRAVASLQERKLIERTTDADDKRAFVLRLTPKGKALVSELLPLVLDFEKGLLGRLDAAERKALLAGLTALERETLRHRADNA
jgi:DNA-binding MarR family transcriptional regulator